MVKYRHLGVLIAAAIIASPASSSGKETLLACYQMKTVAAQYEVTKVLVKKAERKYIKRNNRIELVEYPAIYKENRRLLKPEHEVMQEIPCK